MGHFFRCKEGKSRKFFFVIMSNAFNLINKLYTEDRRTRVYTDIFEVTRKHPQLQIRENELLDVDGSTERVICLVGGLNVQAAGITLPVQIEINIPFAYPTSPPISYLRPAKGFQIVKNHDYVNQDGLCKMPLTDHWHQGAFLSQYIDGLVAVFASAYPLISNTCEQSPSFTSPIQTGVVSPPPYHQAAQLSKKQQLEKKLQAQFQAYKLQSEQEELKIFENFTQLHKNQQRIDGAIKIETQNCEKLEYCASVFTQKINGAQKWIEAERETQQNLTLSNKIQGIGVSEQHVEVVAEDIAYDDAMLLMRQALHKNLLDLDVYLKQIRLLSRKQSWSRAMSNKLLESQQSSS